MLMKLHLRDIIQLFLKDYNIRAELTSTRRAGFHRYTFPKSDNSRIILDLGHQIGNNSSQELSELKIRDNNTIEGVKSSGFGKVYFVAEFSKPFLTMAPLIMNIKLLNQEEISGHIKMVKRERI